VSTDDLSYLRSVKDGVILEVVVVPRGKRSKFLGWHGGFPRFSLAAPPTEGRANEELVRLLSEVLHVTMKSLELIKGSTSKRKQVLVRGATVPSVEAALRNLDGGCL